jgi:hypothetical protein
VRLTGGYGFATGETWVPSGSRLGENRYRYEIGRTTSASVLARTSSGDPIVTRHPYGSGTVYVTTPDLLQDAGGGQMLNVGRSLISAITQRDRRVQLTGPPVEFLVNVSNRRTVVTIVNTDTDGDTWHGTLAYEPNGPVAAVREWTQRREVHHTMSGGRVIVHASVPPYGVRIYSVRAS